MLPTTTHELNLLCPALLLCLLVSVNEIQDEDGIPGAEVVILTASNFEHDTQAASGATTGDWFVKFYAPW